MRTLSWILLALVGLLTLLGSLVSANVAYRSDEDQIGPASLSEVAAGRSDVATALRARRGTAAAYGAGFAVLFLFVVLAPYRRGDVWSWWAILVAMLVLTAVNVARIPLLGTRAGSAAAGIGIGVVVVALLLDARRLRG